MKHIIENKITVMMTTPSILFKEVDALLQNINAYPRNTRNALVRIIINTPIRKHRLQLYKYSELFYIVVINDII